MVPKYYYSTGIIIMGLGTHLFCIDFYRACKFSTGLRAAVLRSIQVFRNSQVFRNICNSAPLPGPLLARLPPPQLKAVMQCVRLLLLAAFIASWHSVLCIPAGKVRTAAPTTAKPTAATPATKGTPATSTGTPAATKASGSAATGTAATAKKAPEEPESSLEVVGDAKWTAHFKHIFHNIDSNKDKTVNRQELKRQIEQIEKDFLSKIKHDEHEDQAAAEALHDEMENEDDASVKAEAEKFFDEELDVKKKDGILTVDELKLLNDGKAGLPEHLQDHDVNADGKVTRKEYIDTEVNLRDMFEKTTTKEFKHIDTNSDGKVDSNEWAHGLVFDGLTQTEIAEEKALEGGMYEFEMERFNEADVNIDGHLDAAEYQLAQMLYQRGVDGSEEDHQATVNKAYDEFSRLTKGQKEPKVSFDQFAQTEIFSGEKSSLEESKKHADGVYALEHARWKKVDADHDGFLNKLEFAAYSMVSVHCYLPECLERQFLRLSVPAVCKRWYADVHILGRGTFRGVVVVLFP